MPMDFIIKHASPLYTIFKWVSGRFFVRGKRGEYYRTKTYISITLIWSIGLLSPVANVYARGFTESRSSPTFVSPYYFGPNAFPIPDVLTKTSDKLKIELAGDYYCGKNYTTDIFLKTHIPLWTHRANLSLWWPVIEWYDDTKNKGKMSGDVYLSIDMQLFEERRIVPSWTLRAALKTASGGGCEIDRYYDCPGYFFDTYFGKTFQIASAVIQIFSGGGFLCWQTDNGRQNDAVQYGVLVGLRLGNFSISETFGGYNGWESNSKKIWTFGL